MTPLVRFHLPCIALQGRFLSLAGKLLKLPSHFQVHMKRLDGFLLFLLPLFLGSLLAPLSLEAAESGPLGESGLIWPLDPPYVFTSTFGEHRPDRFHAGLDFSTGGAIGRPCYAVGDGYVTRVKVNFNGYGKVLYLQLDNGLLAVYAHLDRFAGPLEDEIRRLQEEQEWYEVEEFFTPDRFRFKQGEIVAYTGDTGSGAPHLHFEIRSNMNEVLDPVLEGYVTPDNQTPVISSLSIRPLDMESEVEGDILPVVEEVYHGRAQPVSFYGRVGISVKAHDRHDGTWYRLGLQRFELWVDGELRHVTTPDSFDYQFNRQSRLDFDFELERDGYKSFRRLYRLGPNKLPFYTPGLKGGILDSDSLGEGRHLVEVIVYDDAGNYSSASLLLFTLPNPTLPPPSGNGPPVEIPDSLSPSSRIQTDIRVMGRVMRLVSTGLPEDTRRAQFTMTPFSISFPMVRNDDHGFIGRALMPLDMQGGVVFRVIVERENGELLFSEDSLDIIGAPGNRGVSWTAPGGALELEIEPRDLWFDLLGTMRVLPSINNGLMPVFSFRPLEYPFAKPFRLSFRNPEGKWDSRAVVIYRETAKNGEWTYVGNDLEKSDSLLTAYALSFEDFTVVLDTIPPVVSKYSHRDGARITNRRPTLSIDVKDALSGLELRKCSFLLNGEPVIWAYDPDRDEIHYRPEKSLPRGKYRWEIHLEDRAGNSLEISRTFTIIARKK